MVLPAFTVEGVPPRGDYEMTFSELRQSHLVTGQGVVSINWDQQWRASLVDNLEILVKQLWKVGVSAIFINGSFVEEKDHPNDFDGYFECGVRYFSSGQLERDLNAVDPFKVWTWDSSSRMPDPNSAKRQLPMWHQYRVELYPHFPGLLSGIVDQFSNELEFPSAFRLSRNTFTPKGIVRIAK